MNAITYDQIRIGDVLPPIENPPISRLMLALYAGASGDHNPVHVDLDVARRAGLPDVFAHGMLGMAWLGRMLTQWAPQSQLRRFDVRFAGITQLGHVITCRGRVADKRVEQGVRCALVEVETVNQYGQTRIAGTAVVALP